MIIIFAVNPVKATDNFLNAVVLEGVDNGYNIVLRSDMPAKVKKTIKSSDKIVLTLKGIAISNNVNTLYKNTSNANNIIVENAGNDELNVYIFAKDIAGANVLFNTPNSAPIPVGDRFAKEKLIWAGCSVAFLMLMINFLKSRDRRIAKKITMREREIAFYKAKIPSINYKMAQRAYASSPLREMPKTLRQYQSSLR